MILSGDRNLTQAGTGSQSLYQVGTNGLVHWTGELHGWKGNLLFADGHVEQANTLRLVSSAPLTFAATDLVVPAHESPPPPMSGAGDTPLSQPEALPSVAQTPPPMAPVPGESNNPAPLIGVRGASGSAGRTADAPAARDVPTTPANNAVSNPVVIAPIVVTNDLEVAELAKTVADPTTPRRNWLWLLLLLLVAVAAWRFWRAWRRYCDEITAGNLG
jgi:prepilin-type processing-associated H-X9-DG protein